MTFNRREFTKLATGAAASWALSAPAFAQQKPLRIGLLALRSGAGASIGEECVRAVQWGVERINRGGGIAGRPVEIVVQEETSPKDTIERFRQLVLQDKVDCVQGLVSTGVTLAVAPVAEDERVLLQCWDGTTQNGVNETMPKTNFVFRSTDNECEAVMTSLMTIKHFKGQFVTIAGINNDYSYGRNNWETFKALLARYGIEARVVSEQWVKLGATDLTTNIAALNAAKPDLVFTSMFLADLPIFLRQAQATGLLDRAKLAAAVAGPQINDLRKGFVPQGSVLGQNTLYFAYERASELQKAYVSEYRARHKLLPTTASDRAYFNLVAYKAAVEKAYKTAGRWPKTEEIAAAMAGIEVETLSGKGRYREDKIAEQMFFAGRSRHSVDYETPLLDNVSEVFSDQLQKPAGADYWNWIKTSKFPI